METTDYIASLRIVGGNVALDFANTVDGEPSGEGSFDHLQSYGDLVSWSLRVGLLPEEAAGRLLREAGERPGEAETVHARALEMRGDIYRLFLAVARGETPTSESTEALRRAECEALGHARLVPVEGRFAWEWLDGDLSRVLWSIAHAATELLTSGPLDRIKTCVGCWWLFLDQSKNRSRRWCTMEECGTHEKVRRYLERRAANRKGT